jgi:hypothetical protein
VGLDDAAEWKISEEGPALMLHRPTRLLFEIYLRAAADPSRLIMFDLAARLVHVCDVPEWARSNETPAGEPLLVGQHPDRAGPVGAPHTAIETKGVKDAKERVPDVIVREGLVRQRDALFF